MRDLGGFRHCCYKCGETSEGRWGGYAGCSSRDVARLKVIFSVSIERRGLEWKRFNVGIEEEEVSGDDGVADTDALALLLQHDPGLDPRYLILLSL